MRIARLWLPFFLLAVAASPVVGADNALTPREKREGFVLLFDGKTTNGWLTSVLQPSRTQVEEGALNPHKSGHYMLIHEKTWENFVLRLRFKISKSCNSGIFFRTFPLTPRPGKDVGFNGLEIAIDDTSGTGYHDTGALYDLARPSRNTMKPAGEWNDLELTCDGPRVKVVLNGIKVTEANLDDFALPNRRPDGSEHKFDVAYRDHPRRGYIGLQDHGSPCWFKDIRLKPLRD